MPYYPTLAEDIARAKEILAKGKADSPAALDAAFPDVGTRERVRNLIGGTIFGADIYATYKLLESFVEAIEAVDPKVCKLAIRLVKQGNAAEPSKGSAPSRKSEP